MARFCCAGVLVLGLAACSDSFSIVDLAPQAPRLELKSLPSIPPRVLGPPSLLNPDGSCAGGGTRLGSMTPNTPSRANTKPARASLAM